MRRDPGIGDAHLVACELGEPAAADEGKVVRRPHHLHEPNTGIKV